MTHNPIPVNLNPLSMFGGCFNVSDVEKFRKAIELLKESTNNTPLFVGDNIITWNRNLSFLRDDFFSDFINNEEITDIEKSCVWRLYILLYFADSCKKLDGDFVELGCHKGTTAKFLTERIDFQGLNKHYWLYDLFSWSEGDEHSHMPGPDNPNMYEDVIERFKDKPYVSIIRGSVPDSLDQGFPSKIAFAHIDMNHPDPESGALKKVLPCLEPGGIIVFDDYGWWGYSGQKIALDPIAKKHGLEILELPTGQGLLIKR